MVYSEYPESYNIIALIEASSEFSLQDPSINITWQSKTNKIMERLLIQAAELGANGIVIEDTENIIKQNYTTRKDKNDELVTSSKSSHFKVIKVSAIYTYK